jgi:hypothetical protein
MSIETQPAPTSEHQPPASEVATPDDLTLLEQEFNEQEPVTSEQGTEAAGQETETSAEPSPPSRGVLALRRVADVLFDLSQAMHDRADKYFLKADQNTAYATYADNISTTQGRERTDRQTDRAEYRAEKMEQARDILRGIGRGARGAMVRASVELRYAKIVIGEKVDLVQDSYSTAKETVVGKVAEVRTAVGAKTSEITTAATDTAESIKQKVTLEAELFLDDIRRAVESGKESLDNGMDRVNNKKKAIVNEYNSARAIVSATVSERMSQVGDYFKQRKDAAEVRKAERIAASDARKLESAKQRDILRRTANVEVQKRVDQHEAKKSERVEKARAIGLNRAIGRAAVGPAIKLAVTGRYK